MGLPSFPHSIVWKVSRVSSETVEASDSRYAVWKQYPRPDATVGVTPDSSLKSLWIFV